MDNKLKMADETLEFLYYNLAKNWFGGYKLKPLNGIGLKNINKSDLAVYILNGPTAAQARGIDISQIELYLQYMCEACSFISNNICPLIPKPNDKKD